MLRQRDVGCPLVGTVAESVDSQARAFLYAEFTGIQYLCFTVMEPLNKNIVSQVYTVHTSLY